MSKKTLFYYSVVLLLTLSFRLFIALRLPNDGPDDGRVYAQIARNILEQHVYSHESEPPYAPSLIRLPGYPLFLASIYAVAGHTNNTAVRITQALIDTGTCVLIALLAFQWMPNENLKQIAAKAALALAAICPFTAIYVATILTEVPTNFLAVALALVSTLAFKSASRRRALLLWAMAGLIAGIAVFFRPDNGLFAAAVGFTIVSSALFSLRKTDESVGKLRRFIAYCIPQAALFSLSFCLLLVPWTIRNYRIFHLFQPLSPAHGEMPGEFVPRGYLRWVRTWLDDGRYIGPVIWSLDSSRISINKFPDSAFDSDEERDRVAALLEKYNHPTDDQVASNNQPATPAATPTATPDKKLPQETTQASPTPESTTEEAEQNDEENDEEGDDEESTESQNVEMTPEIDAGFAQIARERVARAPVRYYLFLPIKRAKSLWFDTHSQYYPFEGELLPLDDMDYSIHQQYWLPIFAFLTWIYSMLGIIGGWSLWYSHDFNARRWLLLACLMVFLRLGFFSTLENPESRYVVEIFPFLTVLGGILVAQIIQFVRNRTGAKKVLVSD